jgi:hypothetical protein
VTDRRLFQFGFRGAKAKDGGKDVRVKRRGKSEIDAPRESREEIGAFTVY